jgi:GPH family glycoside/pentoside/hexuronide:cation symporter
MLLYSAINIPYGALSGVMTDEPLERTSLNSYRMALAQIGGIIANSSFMVLIVRFAANNQQLGAQRTVMLFSAIAIVLFLISFATTKERIHPPAEQKTKLTQDLKTLFLNRHWIMMFVVGIVNITLAVVRGSSEIYYLKSYLHWDGQRIGVWFLVAGLSMTFGAMLTWLAVKALGKKWAFISSMALVALTAIPFYWLTPNQTGLIFASKIISMIFTGINATLFWALVADTADFQEWKFQTRTTGVVFSATTCAQKAGMGVGAAFAGFLISYFGYVPNAEQTPDAIHGILLLVSLIPAAGLFLLAGSFTLYGLNEAICKTMREELTQRREKRQP